MCTPPGNITKAMQRYCRVWNDSDPIRGHLELAVSEDCLCVDPQHAHTACDVLTVAEIDDADIGAQICSIILVVIGPSMAKAEQG